MIGWLVAVCVNALRLSSASLASKPETSPDLIWRFDIFSPVPGDSEVTSQLERLSSSETKIAPSCERIAAVSVRGGQTSSVASRVVDEQPQFLIKDRPLSTPMEFSLTLATTSDGGARVTRSLAVT